MITVILILFILIFSFQLLRRKSSWSELSPPTPPLHLILGNIPLMAKLDPKPAYAFHSIAKEFGNLVRLKLGTKFMLLVSRYDEMKEIFNREITEKRANLATSNLIYRGNFETKGILFHSGEEWRELRRFTLKSLKDLGFG